MYLFQKQSKHSQLLTSILTTLCFTTPFESKGVQIIINDCTNTSSYLGKLKTWKYLNIRDRLLHLSAKAKRLVLGQSFEIRPNRKRGAKQGFHELLLGRSLFLCLMHLNHQQIETIQKQTKTAKAGVIPDLVITTRTRTIMIEIDTGSEPISTMEAKIENYKTLGEGELICFTNSRRVYTHFQSNETMHFLWLKSPTLITDLLELKFKPSLNTYKPNEPLSANSTDVKMENDTTDLNLDQKFQELIRSLNEP